MQPGNKCFLEVRGLAVRLRGEEVLRGVSLCVPRGSYLVVLGPSGSGKTTLLRTIAGLVEPWRGDIVIDGRSARGLPPWSRGVALVQQIPGLLPHLSVKENIILAITARRRVQRSIAEEEAKRLLEKLGLSSVSHKRPGELSGGQLQRAALAAALATEPRILLLDEPLSHLDRPLAERLRLELMSLHRELGLTVIHVTHDQDEALSLATRMAILVEGRIRAEGEPAEIYYRPPNLDAAVFLGHNIVDAEVLGLGKGTAVFPPEAVKLVRERVEGAYPARIVQVIRERGRAIAIVRLAGTATLLRAYVSPLEAEKLEHRQIHIVIDTSLVTIHE
jgi:ABC-type Fe3+/spermidine/putrescine transport system ATPase subunit